MIHELGHTGILRWLWVVLIALACALAIVIPVYAENGTAAISQGFTVEGEVTPGAIVSFSEKSKSGAVKIANRDNADRIVGVVSNKPLLELSGGAQQTQVVIGGTAMVLVSNINGDIKYGDKITVSPIGGVGMVATTSGLIVGTASKDFTNVEQVREHKVRDLKGHMRTVKIGLLPVQVNVSYYRAPEDDQTVLPSFLQQFVNAVAGRPVGLIRSLIALLLLVAGFGSVAVLTYASVRSSIISIGRNPLSAPAVHRSLLEVGLMGGGILLVMVIAVYLVLAV